MVAGPKNSSPESQTLCSCFLLPVGRKSSQCTPACFLPNEVTIVLCGLGQVSCLLWVSASPSINLKISRSLPIPIIQNSSLYSPEDLFRKSMLIFKIQISPWIELISSSPGLVRTFKFSYSTYPTVLWFSQG